jgi:hypothetical protein
MFICDYEQRLRVPLGVLTAVRLIGEFPAEQNSEWTEMLRYVGFEIPKRCRRALCQRGAHHRPRL